MCPQVSSETIRRSPRIFATLFCNLVTDLRSAILVEKYKTECPFGVTLLRNFFENQFEVMMFDVWFDKIQHRSHPARAKTPISAPSMANRKKGPTKSPNSCTDEFLSRASTTKGASPLRHISLNLGLFT